MITDQKQKDTPPYNTGVKMGKQRLRPSLFPGCAPYWTFLPPEEKYEDDQEPLDELVMSFAALNFKTIK